MQAKVILMATIFISSIGAFNSHGVEIVVGPYTQNVTNNSITILWETSIPTGNNTIFYRNDSVEYVLHDYSNSKHHELVISPPFNRGYYKIVSDGKESKWLEFKLASYCFSKKHFKCLIMGDSRGTWDGWKNASLVAMAANKEKADVAIHGGDMVTDGRQANQWNDWLNLMKPLMQNTTLFAILGNHERNASRFYEIFSLPNNERYYSFDYGICHFIMLNEYEPWNANSPQYKWLENDLKSSKPFKIVCIHEPIYCSGGHAPRKDIRKVWEPLFIKSNVSLVIQSHNHYYQRTNPINGITYIVTGGAGAPLYSPMPSSIINVSKKAYHYCIMNVSWDDVPEIEFEVKDLQGGIIDEFVLYAYPKVKILKPSYEVYIFDRAIMPSSFPIVIGKITVEAMAYHADEVEFYVDSELKSIDDSKPYSWIWNETVIGKHEIKVKACKEKSCNSDKITVFIMNI